MKTEVLVIGGGTGGICAALQAARSGAQVILTEETAWFGGMLTAAGVSAVDGNHHLPSGLWGEFRQHLYDYYGGKEALASGWVSHTQFEPHAGNKIFYDLAKAEDRLQGLFGFWLEEMIVEKKTVKGAVFCNTGSSKIKITADITIDATEYGDAIALAGCGYRLGRESKSESGEPEAPDQSDDRIQDMTYTAILKDYGEKAPSQVKYAANISDEEFLGCCKEHAGKLPPENLPDALKMLDYGRLPKNKYMINWPNNGNDFYADIVEKNRDERKQILQEAKDYTLAFVHLIQTKLGFPNLGLADDEFPAEDNLPLIPYIRESRRLAGEITLTTRDIVDLYSSPQGSLYKTGIAVGDYPLDHHHGKNELPEPEIFPQISAFNVPYGCLVPKNIDGLLAAEKCISVTHLVNGCTRLQPVIMQIGQAAGAAAAQCIKDEVQPRQISIRKLQRELLDAGFWLMPFKDVTPGDWYFNAVQRIALSGLMKGEAKSGDWVNEFFFHPDNGITERELFDILNLIYAGGELRGGDDSAVTRGRFIQLVYETAIKFFDKSRDELFAEIDGSLKQLVQFLKKHNALQPWADESGLALNEEITRGIAAYVIDVVFNPFYKLPINDLKNGEYVL